MLPDLPEKMTLEEAVKALEALKDEKDCEYAHKVADLILLAVLEFYNQSEVVNAWYEIDKWYV